MFLALEDRDDDDDGEKRGAAQAYAHAHAWVVDTIWSILKSSYGGVNVSWDAIPRCKWKGRPDLFFTLSQKGVGQLPVHS